MKRHLAVSALLLAGLALVACGVTTSSEAGGGSGGTCPCVVGTGITVTLACGASTCYELNGTTRGVSCDEDGQQDDPSACTTGTGGGDASTGVGTGDGGSTVTGEAGTVTIPAHPWPSSIGCSEPATTAAPDCDGDTVPDSTDDCPGTPNADQADANGDGIGDACEASAASCAALKSALAGGSGSLDFHGVDLRACSFLLEAPVTRSSDASSLQAIFDSADLSCGSVTFLGLAASFTGATLNHACVDLSAEMSTPLTLANVTFLGGQAARGQLVFQGGDATGTQFVQNEYVTGNGTTFAKARFEQVTELDLTSCNASGATLVETTTKLKSVDVDGMTCEIGTITCESGLTGTIDPSCAQRTTPPACP